MTVRLERAAVAGFVSSLDRRWDRIRRGLALGSRLQEIKMKLYRSRLASARDAPSWCCVRNDGREACESRARTMLTLLRLCLSRSPACRTWALRSCSHSHRVCFVVDPWSCRLSSFPRPENRAFLSSFLSPLMPEIIKRRADRRLILLLGALAACGPLSIDMYVPSLTP